MNRQQRRLRARQYAVEAQIAEKIYRDQVAVSDYTITAYMICIGLAVHALWGSSKNDMIVPLIQEFNRQVCRVDGSRTNYEMLKKEFEDKTGHELLWADDPSGS